MTLIPVFTPLLFVIFIYVFRVRKLELLDSLIFTLITSSLVIYCIEITNLRKHQILVICVLVVFLLSLIFKSKQPWHRDLNFKNWPILLLFVLIYSRIPANFTFLGWDELSAWVHRSKWLYFSERLWRENQLEYFPVYPPILQLFHQLFLDSSGNHFSERNVMATQFLLTILLLGSIFLNRSYKSNLTKYSALSIGLITPYFFGFSYFTVVPDFLLGLLFAYGLIRIKQLDLLEQRILIIIPLLGFITLLKPTGIVFSLLILVFMYINKSLNIFSLFGCFFSTLFFYASWSVYVEVSGIYNEGFSLAGLIGKFQKFFLQSEESSVESGLQINDSQPIPVLQKMFMDYFDGTIRFSIPFLIISILFVLRYKPPSKYLYFSLLVWVACEGMLFVTYILLMSGFEAKNTASHERYTATFFFAFALIIVAKFMDSEMRSLQVLAITVAIIASSLLSRNLYTEFRQIQPYPDAVGMRQEARTLIEGVPIQEKVSILYVEQNAPSLGYTRLLVAYEAIPSKVQAGCWSFGSPYYDSDIWTCSGSMKARLTELDFIVIKKADSQFFDLLTFENISVEKPLANGIYRIQSSNGTLALKFVRGQDLMLQN